MADIRRRPRPERPLSPRFRKAQRLQDIASVTEQFRPQPLVGVFSARAVFELNADGTTGTVHNSAAIQRAMQVQSSEESPLSNAISPGSPSPAPSLRSSDSSARSGESSTPSTAWHRRRRHPARRRAGISEALVTTRRRTRPQPSRRHRLQLIIGSIRELASRNDDFTLEMLNLVERQQESLSPASTARARPVPVRQSEARANGFYHSQRRTQTALSDINITPLRRSPRPAHHFMVTAPVLQSGIEVNVPTPAPSRKSPKSASSSALINRKKSFSQRSHQHQPDRNPPQTEIAILSTRRFICAPTKMSLWRLCHRHGRIKQAGHQQRQHRYAAHGYSTRPALNRT